MGKAQGDPSIMNIWVHDGSKDLTVNRMKYRELLRDSLDRIFETEYTHMKDCIESKVFGIGLESYTVGSNDFYIGYGTTRQDRHARHGPLPPHGVRRRQDLVAAALHPGGDAARLAPRALGLGPRDDPQRRHAGALQGDRALRRPRPRTHRARLFRRLDQPHRRLRHRLADHAEGLDAGAARTPSPNSAHTRPTDRVSERLALLEESKSLPWNAVWDEFCRRNDVPVGETFIADVQQYERDVTSKRG